MRHCSWWGLTPLKTFYLTLSLLTTVWFILTYNIIDFYKWIIKLTCSALVDGSKQILSLHCRRIKRYHRILL